jgi:glycosyltransferase involved in cell wall biosynthesis
LFDGIDSGAANRSTVFIKALSKIGDVDVISFYKEPIKSNISNCKALYTKSIARKKRSQGKLKKILQHIDVLNPHSFYEIDREREDIVDSFYKKKSYDFIACRYVEDAIVCGLGKYHDKLVIDVDDSPSAAALRQLAITDFPNPWSKYTTRYRAYAVGWMANHFLNKVLCSFYSNKYEVPNKHSIYLPNVTNCSKVFSKVDKDTPLRMLIVGWLDYWPNTYGTTYFAKNIFPKIQRRIPAAELHIAGKTKNAGLLEDLNNIPGVSALGYVKDLEAEYQNSRICIVPVYHGAGTSVKFVEGLSMGRTVVSTPMGARGFDDVCKDGEDYELASTDEMFVEKIVHLLPTVTELNRIGRNGYRIAKTHFSQERFCQIVKNAIVNK